MSAQRPSGTSTAARRRLPGGTLGETVLIVAFAVLLAFLIQAFLVKPYRIPSASMVPTLAIGQRVLVNRVGTHFGDPQVGDIVVFHPPAGADRQPAVCGSATSGVGTSTPCARNVSQRSRQTFIKRVVGVGGDRIAIRDGHVIRNGVRQREPFARPCGNGIGCTFAHAITVPRGELYMMGDNRGVSDDSRFWGPVPLRWVIGTAFATYWPPDRIGGL